MAPDPHRPGTRRSAQRLHLWSPGASRRAQPAGNQDDTIRIVPVARRGRAWPWVVAGVAGCASIAGVAFHLLTDRPPPAPPVIVAVAPPAPAPAVIPPPVVSAAVVLPPPTPFLPVAPVPPTAPPTAPPQAAVPEPTIAAPIVIPASATQRPALPRLTEAEILARSPEVREVYRFAAQPEVVVIQFPDLADQARTLNRVAALIEKAGFPRDRVLPDAELDRAIRAGGDQPDTFYLGHDYRAADILRFFQEAERQGIALTPQEQWLQRQVAAWEWRPGMGVGGGVGVSGGVGAALISLTRPVPSAGVDRSARATILRHELSHGAYFTRPDYSAYTQQFWRTTLSRNERAMFRTFLAAEGYDTTLDDLMMNEMQAYLMHTADRRFFEGTRLGLTAERLDMLRGHFLTGMPPNWLRDCTFVPPREP